MNKKDIKRVFYRLVLNNNDFVTFNLAIEGVCKTPKEKGDLQEYFSKMYFESHWKHFNVEKYYSHLFDGVPEELGVCVKDIGTDAVIVHKDGKISLVQVKYRKENKGLGRGSMGNLSIEALPLMKQGKLGNVYLFSNTSNSPFQEEEKKVIKHIDSDILCSIEWGCFQRFVRGKIKEVEKKDEEMEENKEKQLLTSLKTPLRIWQKNAFDFVTEKEKNKNGRFVFNRNFGRKTVVSACGTGKTLFADKILNCKNSIGNYIYKKTLVIVPNLHLLNQWFERLAFWRGDRNFLLVGSDLDTESGDLSCFPYTLTTSKDEIKSFYEENNEFIVISTYQSLDKVLVDTRFDLSIADEAHLTCGQQKSNFTLVCGKEFPSKNFLFLTATPKVYKGFKHETIVSMDNTEIYGKQFIYSFKDAIEDEIISDYQVVIGHGKEKEEKVNYEKFEATFLCQSIKKYNLTSVLVCSPVHSKSRLLYLQTQEKMKEFNLPHKLIMMKENATSKDKIQAINEVEKGIPVIIFNVRVFGLGSDIPKLSSVMLVGNRSSVIDIVQTCSRALRKTKEKELAYILIPCLIENEEDFLSDGSSANVRKIISSIGTCDSGIVDFIVSKGLKREVLKNKIVTDIVGTYEWELEKEEKRECTENDFELLLYNRFCERSDFSPFLRFELLLEFCTKNKRLPKYEEEYKEVKIGIFLDALLAGKRCISQRDNWISQLKETCKEVEDEIEKRLNNRNDPEKKASRSIPIEKRFEQLLEFCKKEKRLPKQNKRNQDENKLGLFLGNLFERKSSQWDNWIKKLKETCKEVEDEIEKRLNNRNDPEKKASRSIPTEKRFEQLLEFCKKEKRLPKQNKRNQDENKLGVFLNDLLGGRKRYPSQRQEWLRSLSAISLEIKQEIIKRAKNFQP